MLNMTGRKRNRNFKQLIYELIKMNGKHAANFSFYGSVIKKWISLDANRNIHGFISKIIKLATFFPLQNFCIRLPASQQPGIYVSIY